MASALLRGLGRDGAGSSLRSADGTRAFAPSTSGPDGAKARRRKPILSPPTRVRGVVHILKERCKGCEFCIDYCPTDVLELSSAFNAKGYHYPVVVNDECIDCQACRNICPEYAIFSTAASPPPGRPGRPRGETEEERWRRRRS